MKPIRLIKPPICAYCNKYSTHIGKTFGWRIMNGKKHRQSYCKKCRSFLVNEYPNVEWLKQVKE